MNLHFRLRICFAALKHAWQCCNDLKRESAKLCVPGEYTVSGEIRVNVKACYLKK
jgi:hypothetical protein